MVSHDFFGVHESFYLFLLHILLPSRVSILRVNHSWRYTDRFLWAKPSLRDSVLNTRVFPGIKKTYKPILWKGIAPRVLWSVARWSGSHLLRLTTAGNKIEGPYDFRILQNFLAERTTPHSECGRLYKASRTICCRKLGDAKHLSTKTSVESSIIYANTQSPSSIGENLII